MQEDELRQDASRLSLLQAFRYLPSWPACSTCASAKPLPDPPNPAHLRPLLRRQRKGLAGLQQRLLPPGGLLWQQVAGKLSVDDTWVQRVGCSRGGGGQGKGRGQGRSVCAREQYSGREAMRRGRLI